LNWMAIASAALSLFAFFVPFGIASVVMGHISRKQIAQSGGRQKGKGIALAGLCISYFQFVIVALVCVVVAAAWRKENQSANQDSYARAAEVAKLLEWVETSATSNRQNVADTLRLIHTRQTEYLAANPLAGYACTINVLESSPGAFQSNPVDVDDELSMYVRRSNYEFWFRECGMDAAGERHYTVLAGEKSGIDDTNWFGLPKQTTNSGDPDLVKSKDYCVDETGIVRSGSMTTNEHNSFIH